MYLMSYLTASTWYDEFANVILLESFVLTEDVGLKSVVLKDIMH